MRNTLRFILNGKLEEIENCLPDETVLDFLRDRKKLTGSKEGCAEGDCGACTVVLGETIDGTLRYSAVNSCILFLPTLDGKQLITIEALSEEGKLHPVQQALVDQHGSQCGFCTPGFVMSMLAMYHDSQEKTLSREYINANLAGNLCRCTGYAPIVRAVHQSMEGPRDDQFAARAASDLERLNELQSDEMLDIRSGDRRFFSPTSLAQLCQTLEEHPEATIVAGATDVGLWVTKQLFQPQVFVYTGKVAELREIRLDDDAGELSIGAAVSYTEALPFLLDAYPDMEEMLTRLGAVQVRNAGTIGGNIANGSPIGDMPPALIALGARLVVAGTAGERTLDLEDFFIDYGKQDLLAGECVARVLLPVPARGQHFRCYKISKRMEQDISAVCAAFSIILDQGTVLEARVAIGGMAATPARASACESALAGKPWSEDSVDAAMQAMNEDFTPISDMRASAPYRMLVARNLLKRFYLETALPAATARLSRNDQAGDRASPV